MIFKTENREYDSSEMKEVQIGATDFPKVYIAPDYSAIVLLQFTRELGIDTIYLTPEQLRRMGNNNNTPALSEAIEEMNKHFAFI